MKSLILAAAAVAATVVGTSPANAGAIDDPKSVDTVQRLVMPAVDAAALLAEDESRERSAEVFRPRFASPLEVALTPGSSGTWETLADGSRLWRLRISSPGALSLNLGLDLFELPEGASFRVHDSDGGQVRGPYTARDCNFDGGLWTAVVLGDELVAELRLPAGTDADLRISSVNHGYRYFGAEDAMGATYHFMTLGTLM